VSKNNPLINKGAIYNDKTPGTGAGTKQKSNPAINKDKSNPLIILRRCSGQNWGGLNIKEKLPQ
jgi:hypothetical protein